MSAEISMTETSEACRWEWPLMLLLLALLTLSLSWNLSADLPGNLDGSAGLVFDPPSKCHNARNHALWGEWIIDEWTPVVHSPLHTLLQRIVYATLGQGLAQIRLPDLAASLLACFLFWRLARFVLEPRFAMAAAWCVGGTYPFFIYGRSGLLEPLALAGGLATLYFFARSLPELGRPVTRTAALFLMLAGCCTVLSLLAKATAWPFVAATLLLCLRAPDGWRKSLPWFLLGALPLALLYACWFYPTLSWAFARETSYWSDRAAHTSLLTRWLRQPLFVQTNGLRFLLGLAILALPLALHPPGQSRNGRAQASALGLALVFLVGTQFLAFVNYRPLRYYLPYLPGAVLLAFLGLQQLARGILRPEVPNRSPLRWGLGWLALGFVLHFGLDQVLWPALWRLWRPEAAPRFLLHLGLSGALLALLWLASARATRLRQGWPPALRTSLAWAILLLPTAIHLGTNLPTITTWLSQPTFAMRDFSRRLGEDYRDMVIGGTSPLFAVMENTHRAIKITSYDLNPAWMRERRLTHLLIPQNMGQERVFNRLFADEMKEATLLGKVAISGYTHALYAFRLEALRGQKVGPHQIEITNPDRHTPQSLVVVAWTQGEGLRTNEAVSLNLRPGEQRRLDLPITDPSSHWYAVNLRRLTGSASPGNGPAETLKAATPQKLAELAFWQDAP